MKVEEVETHLLLMLQAIWKAEVAFVIGREVAFTVRKRMFSMHSLPENEWVRR